MDTRGILESRVVWGALPLPLPQPQHLSRWWYLPDLPKVKKKAAKQRAAVPPSQAPAGQSSWDTVLQALVNIGLDESVLGKIREKISGPPPLEKKKERHLANLRDKRDKAQRVLDRLVEDADKKRVLYEEACAKVKSQREELDDIVRQVAAAQVQVNLPTPPPLSPVMMVTGIKERRVVLKALKMKPGGRLKPVWEWT